MEEKKKLLYIATADIEEPDCMKCHNCIDGDKCDKCGAEYWWSHYERYVYEDDDEELKNE